MAAPDRPEPEGTAPDGGERALDLRQGRTLTVATEGDDELLEIRGSSGLVELRVRMTEQGAVLEMDVVRLSLRAAEAIDLEAKAFNVTTEESLGLSSKGEIAVRGQADVVVDAEGEVHVKGDMIFLN